MAKNGFFLRTLSGKFAALGVSIALIATGLTVANLAILSDLEQMPTRMNYIAMGPTHAAELELALRDLQDDAPAARREAQARTRELMARVDRRFRALLEGAPDEGLGAMKDPEAIRLVSRNREIWQTDTAPLVESMLRDDAAEIARSRLPDARQALSRLNEKMQGVVDAKKARMRADVRLFWSLQFAFLGTTLLLLAGIALHVRRIVRAVAETTDTLASASTELLAGTTQQASSAQEQAAAVSETVTTVDEVLQTAEQAVQRVQAVATSAQRAADIGRSGRQAIEASVAAMARVQEKTGSIAQTILSLAERSQAIGEIIEAVNDVAEQTNLLALNASIEAARAGEHGAGFAVVAREIKDLSDQAKKATAQVRRILGEIQRSMNGAVLVTEEGSKAVDGTIEAVHRAGETIAMLAETIEAAAVAAAQITASASQQSTGMSQVQQAMRDINEATTQTTASTRQAEQAARDLHAHGMRLRALMGQ